MIFWFNRAEVYVGFSMKDFSDAKEILAQNKIPYAYRVDDSSQKFMGRGTMRSDFGSSGMDSGVQQMYYLYVKKADSERAKYLIGKESHAG